MTDQICKKCKKRPVYVEHSTKYCFRCYETRRDGNIKYRNAHKKENCERTKAWVVKNQDKVKEYSKQARLRARINPSSTAKFSAKEWKQSTAGKASRKRDYEKNKDKVKEQVKLYVQKNKDAVRERIKKWNSENKDRVLGYIQKYRSLHPEQMTKSSRKRREIFKNVVGNFTLAEWISLCNKFGNKCLWCERTDRKLTIDHVVPITKGGTNYIDNIQPLCVNCNARKNNSTIDFRPFGSAIMEWT